jgi:hypothetical protein
MHDESALSLLLRLTQIGLGLHMVCGVRSDRRRQKHALLPPSFCLTCSRLYVLALLVHLFTSVRHFINIYSSLAITSRFAQLYWRDTCYTLAPPRRIALRRTLSPVTLYTVLNSASFRL